MFFYGILFGYVAPKKILDTFDFLPKNHDIFGQI